MYRRSNFILNSSVVVAFLWVVLWIGGIVGWVMNLFAIAGLMGGEITAMLLVRCIGAVIFPLGAVIGWF